MATALTDSFGRIHTDLRISVTDRCNFRCSYCMPAEGLEWLSRSALLSFEEIARMTRLLVERLGIRSARLTGGEPTMRANLDELIRQLAAIDGLEDLALTTNGTTLVRDALSFYEAGLTRVNVSLDSMNRATFLKLTRRDSLTEVLGGIEAAIAAGFQSVKINVVVIAGVNDHEVVDIAQYGRDVGAEVRFIEFMPLDADEAWESETVVDAKAIVERVTTKWPATKQPATSSPARRYVYDDGCGEFGVIGSVSEPFCSSCDRIRLTAEGEIRNCLFATRKQDVQHALRSEATDDELVALVVGEVERKAAGHGIGTPTFIRPNKSMSQIGG